MADVTYNDHPEDNSPTANDYIPYWDVADSQAKRALRSALVGATLTGGGAIDTGGNTLTLAGNGTLDLGGNTLTVPASGTAALLGTAQTYTARPTFADHIITGRVRIDPGSGQRGWMGDVVGPQTVGTTPVPFGISTRASVVFVYGKGAGAVYSMDLIFFLSFAAVSVIASYDWGAPPARTFGANGNQLLISLASGTMDVQTMTLGLLFDPA